MACCHRLATISKVYLHPYKGRLPIYFLMFLTLDKSTWSHTVLIFTSLSLHCHSSQSPETNLTDLRLYQIECAVLLPQQVGAEASQGGLVSPAPPCLVEAGWDGQIQVRQQTSSKTQTQPPDGPDRQLLKLREIGEWFESFHSQANTALKEGYVGGGKRGGEQNRKTSWNLGLWRREWKRNRVKWKIPWKESDGKK